ncbi:MAG TPA: M1 family metallopeptidase [Gemmatimonadaceae bacterium]|nr:M1 family metallopeptidase [Gemmatimonadaceae bacterium]
MSSPSVSLPTLALALVVACAPAEGPGPAQVEQRPVPADVHSYARPDSARVTHVSLDIAPDFEAKRIRGSAALTVERKPGADTVLLDARGLTITRVTSGGGEQLGFILGESRGFLGSRLAVELPGGDTTRATTQGAARADTIVVHYETAPDAAALQWLTPAQTAGRRMPFLFTQGQAILTRTWIPTQDSPGIRQTYSAVVRVPAGMRAVMSAETVGGESERDEQGRSVFRFNLRHPVPPYLFALAVGDIAFRAIGPSTGVYAEPSVVERAANEFAEVDDMIAAAERLYGPYRWGRYDILVLPPSFPFGGMENPTLTFATPTILAGDRSLVALVAHELAHSWSGNLVTNATWDDFWLNEGFTTYLEARIMEAVRGQDYADMLRQLGRQDLEETLATTDSADTRLRLDLEGRDPDDGVTSIAYEKGSAFLQTIEAVVGRERLDAWLRSYFDRNAFRPMTTEWLLEDMRANLLQEGEAERVRLDEWAYQPGMPSNVPPVQSRLLAAVDSQVARWRSGTPASALPTAGWSTHEWLHFLRALPDTIGTARLAEMDRQFRLSESGNAEILQTWLVLAIRNRYEPAFPALDRFLTSQGRRKFLTPLYTELMRTPWGRTMARDIYRRARPTYHSVATGTIDGVVQWEGR